MDPVTTGALVGAGTSILGNAAGGIFKPGLKRQWKYQQKQMALQQQYALEQLQKQAELNYTNWQKQFDYENSYNDPSKVFDRYLKAGVTPAAVLGSSGVGVSATMSPSGASAGGASGPSAGSMDFSSPIPGLGTAAAGGASSLMQASAASERDRAAADRDRAEADDIRSKMQAPEYYKTVADLNVAIQNAGVDNAKAVADMNRALADIYQADAAYADLSATYKFQDLVAQYSKHVEEYNGLRKYNVEYMDRVLDAQIALDAARAYEAMASGGELKANTALAGVRLADAQNWFDVNWNVEVEVPRYDEKGKVVKTERYTGKQIAMELRSLDLSTADLSKAESRWSVRNEKNRLGYDMLRYFSGAVGAAAGSAMTRAAGGPVHMSEISTEHYDRNGEFIRGTMVRRSDIRGRSRK